MRHLLVAALAVAAFASTDAAARPGNQQAGEIRLPMRNVYQRSETYRELFGPNGSMICGAAAMANALLYLRDHDYSAIGDGLIFDWREEAVVRSAFNDCGVNQNDGVGPSGLLVCARAYMHGASARPDNVWTMGFWRQAADSPLRRTPTPRDLQTVLDQGGVALLFLGGFERAAEGAYRELGGHWVTLAGRPAQSGANFYISDPLRDYGDGPASHAINLAQLSGARFVDAQGVSFDFAGSELWHFATDPGRIAIVKGMVVLAAPRPNTTSNTTLAASN